MNKLRGKSKYPQLYFIKKLYFCLKLFSIDWVNKVYLERLSGIENFKLNC